MSHLFFQARRLFLAFTDGNSGGTPSEAVVSKPGSSIPPLIGLDGKRVSYLRILLKLLRRRERHD